MVPSATDAWTATLKRLRKEIPSRTVENWLVPIDPISLNDSSDGVHLVLEVPTAFNAQYLQSRFNSNLQRAVSQAVGQKTEIEFRVSDSPSSTPSRPTSGPNRDSGDLARAAAHTGSVSSGDGADMNGQASSGHSSATGDASGGSANGNSSNGNASTQASPNISSVQAEPTSGDSSVDPRSRPSRSHGSSGHASPGRGSSGRAGRESSGRESSGRESSGRKSPGQASSGDSAGFGQRNFGSSDVGSSDYGSRNGRRSGSRESTPRPPAHRKVNRPDSRRVGNRNGSSGGGNNRTVSTPQSHLKASYTFDEFIEGDGNRLARSAAFAVAESPGETNYNPLLIYGGVGLGKTHLAQAIANHALRKKTTESVLYVSSDRFTSQFVRSVKNNSIADFSAYYRQADLLIVDDVQFFGGKEKTQEEFFHIFNDLHQHGRQIVLCADRPPSEIDGIEERLLSRFQWGLSADIQRPDLETRIAILQRKANRRNIDVDPRVVELLAHRIDSNIRKLEGALNRLAALAQLDNKTVSIQAARQLLQDQIDVTSTSRVECGSIIETVADYYRLTVDDLLSRSRKREIASARQTAMYLCREMTNESYASIGSRFGGRDHSTVIHAHKKVTDRKDVETAYRREIEDLKRSIGGPSFE
jgi:chromosomal replication initiator protein